MNSPARAQGLTRLSKSFHRTEELAATKQNAYNRSEITAILDTTVLSFNTTDHLIISQAILHGILLVHT